MFFLFLLVIYFLFFFILFFIFFFFFFQAEDGIRDADVTGVQTCALLIYLRFKKRPKRFALIKIINVVLTILFNLFFFLLCPFLKTVFPNTFAWFDISKGVDYILISNLAASVIQLLLVSPELKIKFQFDSQLLKKMLKYSFPILILGVAGILNQTVDKIIFPKIYPDTANAFTELGIYGQNFKIAIIMVMFTQAFRYAFEPYIFSRSEGDIDQKRSFSDATKYFIIFGLLIFLVTTGFIDIIKFMIPPEYHVGLKVVPIVLLGELFFGIYFNLSLWYKLTDQTRWGAYMSVFGFIITIAINVVFIPKYSYMACAWASFFANLIMMVISYVVGQKKYPVPYNLKSAAAFFSLSIILFGGITVSLQFISNLWLRLFISSVFIVIYIGVIVKKELPLNEWPMIGKYFR